MASTAKTAITAKTKITLKAMVTLFPKKHGEKLHCTIRYLNITVCHMHVNIKELKRFKHECIGRYCYFHLKKLFKLIFVPTNKAPCSVCNHTLYLYLQRLNSVICELQNSKLNRQTRFLYLQFKCSAALPGLINLLSIVQTTKQCSAVVGSWKEPPNI